MSLRITVVGAGIMGLCTAWALARRGHTVSVFDQGQVPNPFGSSVDQHRLFRHAYGNQTGYARMADTAFQAWERLWTDLGERLLVPSGTLCTASAEDGRRWLADSAAVLEALGHPFRRLTRAQIAAEFPLVDASAVAEGLHMTSGGVLLAGRIVELLSHHLNALGVTVHARNPVTAIDAERASVTLADRRVIGADVLVVAAGAWVTKLLPETAGRLVPSRQVVAYLTPPEGLRGVWANAPMLIDADSDSGVYVVPPVAGTTMKAGDHRFSRSGDPDADRDPDPEEARDVLDRARRVLADGHRYSLANAATCFYTVTADERFVIESLSQRAWLMSPCSGHGFKFAPALGEALAAAVDNPEEGRRTLPHWAGGY
ncbi:NAD(P)/FAD-dependent oxidoreductase [Azospirillum rugosum]|uniref:Sarcosine oxidase n=1 Tax=Azospirillum rugosum TaxID=416170 RepID=A0ABS4ST35_9PROT|nr:FAD-dependent oxidoreductase [Azospirillum rugosum]MBP2295602.1 sarcosine oxidase [Azospirillum rugosum]MDQ0529508.1 sarcosine oxidase [Azospirillum rugosum]